MKRLYRLAEENIDIFLKNYVIYKVKIEFVKIKVTIKYGGCHGYCIVNF